MGKFFEGLKIDKFHKTLGLSALYKGKSLADLKEVIIIGQAKEGVVKYLFSDPKNNKKYRSRSSNF